MVGFALTRKARSGNFPNRDEPARSIGTRGGTRGGTRAAPGQSFASDPSVRNALREVTCKPENKS